MSNSQKLRDGERVADRHFDTSQPCPECEGTGDIEGRTLDCDLDTCPKCFGTGYATTRSGRLRRLQAEDGPQ